MVQLTPSHPAASMMSVIRHWKPEDRGFWLASGRSVATRNLWLSAAALVLSFAVWVLWSVVVVQLPAAGFRYSTNQLFWLTALPALCGATLRIIYGFALPRVGGRRFTVLTSASLLLPAAGMGLAVQDPTTPFEWMAVLALLCGLGGANFASSMANIRLLFPHARQRCALGLNAGLGHLGVALAQWLVPLAISIGIFGAFNGPSQPTQQGPMWLQNAGFVWVPLILASSLAAAFGMDDLAAGKSGFAEQAVLVTRKQNWRMSWLYMGSFGSFIGFAVSMPLLLQSQFPHAGVLAFVWLGPLLTAALRPVGDGCAVRLGAARVTFWAFVAMALGALVAQQSLPGAALSDPKGSVTGFLVGFGLIFAATGVANGSVFRMVFALSLTERLQRAERLPSAQTLAASEAAADAGAALGFASAIGAYGAFFIPKSLGTALALTGSPAVALLLFIVFYVSCIALTWSAYSRRNAPYPC